MVAALLTVGTVVWSVRSRSPECGPTWVAALTDAADQLRVLMPALEADADTYEGDCGMDGNTIAQAYPGFAWLESDGAAAACMLGDVRKPDEEAFCHANGAHSAAHQ